MVKFSVNYILFYWIIRFVYAKEHLLIVNWFGVRGSEFKSKNKNPEHSCFRIFGGFLQFFYEDFQELSSLNEPTHCKHSSSSQLFETPPCLYFSEHALRTVFFPSFASFSLQKLLCTDGKQSLWMQKFTYLKLWTKFSKKKKLKLDLWPLAVSMA